MIRLCTRTWWGKRKLLTKLLSTTIVIQDVNTQLHTVCLQCFYTVGWASGRAYGHRKISDGVLTFFLYCVQLIVNQSSSCHCHPCISYFSKIQKGLLIWCWHTQIVPERRPLNICAMLYNITHK